METTKRELIEALNELGTIGKFEFFLYGDKNFENLAWVEKQHDKLLHILYLLDKVISANVKIYINRTNELYTAFAVDGERLYIYTGWGCKKDCSVIDYYRHLQNKFAYYMVVLESLEN